MCVLAIRCVAFDAVGTLIHPVPSASQVYWETGRRFGSQQSIDQVRSAFHATFERLATGSRGDYSTSESEEYERWRQIVGEVLFDVSDKATCFRSLHAHFANPTAWQVFPDVEETLRQLVDLEIEILVASNFDGRLDAICEGIPVLRLFKKRVISASVGWHKPSPHFYSRLIEMAGCGASEILMVGDDFENDVVAARSCGVIAAWIQRDVPESGESITDLRQIIPIISRPGTP